MENAQVTQWYKRCKQPEKPKPTKKGNGGSQTPPLTGNSRNSSLSVPTSNRSAFSNTVGVRVVVKEESGGLSDHDEMVGEEVEHAQQSPVKKRRVRARSDVSVLSFCVCNFCKGNLPFSRI